ncbi:LOW QUALITY PROTEIN: hypothetical protein ACHAXA_004212 [Cyclostephanos tholiformis]|uniref:Uncharacterized protein n=1 Tax=Cyclostephanos tholiformis TaxID=382380 RepID=A0ABD3RFK8_9STRA
MDSKNKMKNSNTGRKKNAKDKMAAAAGDYDSESTNLKSNLPHPYPTTIAIQSAINDGKNNNSDDDDGNHHHYHNNDYVNVGSPSNDNRRRGRGGGSEFRSPFTSPGQRGGGGGEGGGGGGGGKGSEGRRGRSRSESRQPNSPMATGYDAGVVEAGDAYSSELAKYHRDGLRQFNMNRLSEAVESYSRALRVGLEELAHRVEMVNRMSTGHGGVHDTSDKDGMIMAFASSISRVHADLGRALEIAQKYGDARREYVAGMDILRHTCHVTEEDARMRGLRSDVARMTRAIKVENERRKQAASLVGAYQRLDRASNGGNPVDRDNARRALMSCLEKAMRIERDTLGEGSYGYAKLRLKLSKVKCEYGDVEGGTVDADNAARTIKSLLGSSHAIVGAASSFVAAAYERRANMMYDRIKSKISPGGGDEREGRQVQLTPECKSMFTKALEWYADALGPMKFKYDRENCDGDDRDDRYDNIQPDVGEIFHKISKLYIRRGNGHGSAVDACHRALEAYGVGGCIDPANATKSEIMDGGPTSLYGNFHPDAAFVWRDLAHLHLTAREYGDAVYAAERALESSHRVLRGAHCDRKGIEVLPSSALNIAGDGYVGLRRYEDATRSYREAYSEFRRLGNANHDDTIDGATILRKLGMTFYHRGMFDEAKAHLMDALSVERSSKDHGGGFTGSSSGLPLLLSDIGMVHIKCDEYAEATKALRSCLKLYADRGVSEHTAEVKRARQLFKEAQRRPMDAQSLIVDPWDKNKMQEAANGCIPMNTPASKETVSTMPSPLTMPSTNYSQTSSGACTSRSGQGQLETLLEELAVANDDAENVLSLMPSGHHDKSLFRKSFPAELNSSTKLGRSSLEEGDSIEIQRLKIQLGEFKASNVEKLHEVDRLNLRIKELERERDQGKNERVLAAVAHQKEMAAVTQANVNHAVMTAELDSLRKLVNVSETAYKELVAAIDNEKEKIIYAHASQVQQLEAEIEQLRHKCNQTGAIESSRLLEELAEKRKEISMLNEQCQKSSREMSSLTATNRKLESEKDTAAREISVLKSKIDQLQSELKSRSLSENIPERNKDIKKLEFELQSERNRRVILESSLQKEYDRPSQPPPCIPYGYPPMQMPMQMYAPDSSSINKLKIMEIDLATERANKELLDNIIQELRSAHEQEASDLHCARAEVDQLNRELEKVKCANDELSCRLNDTSNELSHSTSELSDIKNQMLQISCELSSTIEEKNEEKRKLSNATNELLSTKQDLHKINEEVKNAKEALRRKETEVEYWSSENARLKKEYSEAIEIFEAEIFRAKEDKEEMGSSLNNKVRQLNSEVQRQSNDLDAAKFHLQNMLVELEAAKTEVKNLNIALDSARAALRTKEEQLNQDLRMKEEQLNQDLRMKEEQLNQARIETGGLKDEMNNLKGEMNNLVDKYKELTAFILRAQESICSDQRAFSEENDETLKMLRTCETAVEIIITTARNLKAENNALTARLLLLGELNKKMESFLCSIPRQLECLSPDLYCSPTTGEEAPDDEDSNASFEIVRNQIYHLLRQVCSHINELKGILQSKENALEKTQWNLSNAVEDLDKIESKYKALKKQMKDVGNLQEDYNELRDQYELVLEDKEELENHLTSIHLKKEQKLKEERDLFESQLREAVDDLEELEGERDALKVLHDIAMEESGRKDGRIRALEIDNQLIEVLEKQALEYDAALFQKDLIIKTLEGELQSAQSELKPSVHRGDISIFPNIPYASQQDTARMEWFEENASIQEHSSKNSFAGDPSSLPDKGDKILARNPFDEDSSVEECNDCRGSVFEVDGSNESLKNASASEWEQQDLTLNKTDHTLGMSTRCREEATMASNIHEVDSEAILCLQNALDKNNEIHREELTCLKEKILELQNICCQSMAIVKAELGRDDAFDCLRAYKNGFPQDENDQNDQTFDLNDIANLPSVLTVFSSQTKHEVILLQNEIQTLKGCIEKLSAQLARSEANTTESTMTHKAAMIEQEKIHQAARENDLALIASLENALREKEIQLRDKMQQALKDQDELHRNEISTLKSQITQLEKSNKDMNLELTDLREQTSISIPDDHTECNRKLSLVQMDLQKSLIDNDNDRTKHSIELASINGELHNAMVAIDELSKENLEHKRYIEILSSKETVADRNFEKEMCAAHTRFESMEKALQKRVLRLEREKDKLVADFNAERTNMDKDHTKTRIELCAWKLEMQNALNEIESLKKERNELNDQVEAYGKSLEAVCVEKAIIDEKMHTLGM